METNETQKKKKKEGDECNEKTKWKRKVTI